MLGEIKIALAEMKLFHAVKGLRRENRISNQESNGITCVYI
jgi:hypothetical protein